MPYTDFFSFFWIIFLLVTIFAGFLWRFVFPQINSEYFIIIAAVLVPLKIAVYVLKHFFKAKFSENITDSLSFFSWIFAFLFIIPFFDVSVYFLIPTLFVFLFAALNELVLLRFFTSERKLATDYIFFWEPAFIIQSVFLAGFMVMFGVVNIPSIYSAWITVSVIFANYLYFILYILILNYHIKSLVLRKEERPAISYRKLQILPYFLSLVQTLLFIVILILIYFISYYYFAIPGYPVAVFEFTLFIMFLVGQLYILLWTKKRCSILIKNMRKNILPKESGFIRSPVGLRFKMGIWFGTLGFLSITFAGFFGYIQYEAILGNFLNKKAETEIKRIKSELNESYTYLRNEHKSAILNAIIKKYSSDDDGYYYHIPGRGGIYSVHKEGTPPALPVMVRSLVRTSEKGDLDIHTLNLYGAYSKILNGKKEHGTLVVLYSGKRLFPFDRKERLLSILLFFIITGIVILGGVGYFVSEFTKPLKHMEEEVSVIVSGNFDKKIKFEGEEDEIGRLSLALENLRRNIRDKIATIEQMNKTLENKVSERTKDLAKANKELKYALDVLRQTQDQLVLNQKLASLGQLLAGLAHEINNPLNTISNTLKPLNELINDITTDTGEDDVQDIKTMLAVLNRGTSRIKGVLDRITGTLQPGDETPEKVNLEQVIENSLILLKKELSDVKVIKEFKLKQATVQAHQIPLEQVFSNLIVNAVHAMENMPEKILRITIEQKGSNVVAKVSDTGEGIPPEIKDKIFDPFFSTKSVGKGMGLGLSIVYDIVNRYSGTIVFSDVETGRGTVVTLEFPLYSE